ncbi:hypothetical protein N7532_007664 [Penicillium argentinense]|uniref:Uncharacterized protein n=1 Tax=Penicillium argentinense TaxID=1131581 RepID=A0A9W9K150_9EURO|nr:uncharacterized protein N7532_007664 [Penicillium argentinense]KAJ5088980.1 hypothetical protein N7532_007664 [Penicillium argentinense]
MSPAPNAHASGGAALPKPPSDKQLDIPPGPFKSVQDGLALLIVALETAETAALAADSSDLHASIEKELQGCDETLLALRKLKRQYNVGDSQSEADQTPVNEETTKELEELREKLTSYTSTLNLLNANTVRSVLSDPRIVEHRTKLDDE